MSTARRRLKSPRSLSGTSAHPTMVTPVNIIVMNGWLRSFSFHVNRPPHSWDKAISDSDLETPRSWVWSNLQGHTIGPVSYILTHIRFISHQSDQQFLRYSYFEIWPWNIQGPRSWVRSKVKVTYFTQCTTNSLPFRFTSIGPTIPKIWPK